MSNQTDIAKIIEQEQRLVFHSFREEDAFAIGCALKRRADEAKLGIVIDVALWDRKLFYYACPGTTSDNEDWVRRKINIVRRFHKSSYRMGLELAESGRTLADRNLSSVDYAAHGGCFPINVKGAGIIGTVTISGLPQRQDHIIVVEELARHLNISLSGIELDSAVPN